MAKISQEYLENAKKEDQRIALLVRLYFEVKEAFTELHDNVKNKLLSLAVTQFLIVVNKEDNTVVDAIADSYEKMGISFKDLNEYQKNLYNGVGYGNNDVLTNFAEVIASAKNAEYLLERLAHSTIGLTLEDILAFLTYEDSMVGKDIEEIKAIANGLDSTTTTSEPTYSENTRERTNEDDHFGVKNIS